MTSESSIDRSYGWLHDTARCLALVRQNRLELQVGGCLRPEGIRLLVRSTGAGARYAAAANEHQAPLLSFMVRLLVAGGLVGQAGERLLLSEVAYDWLGRPPERQLHTLRQIWFLTPELWWCWLPAGQRRAYLTRWWEYVVLEGIREIVELELMTWIPVSDLLTGLRERGVLTPGGVAQNLPRVRRATERRTERVLRILWEGILPCLGFCEVQGKLLKPTAEGACWLGAALALRGRMQQNAGETAVELAVPHHQLSFPVLEDPLVTVRDDLSLTVQPEAPAAYTFEIAHWAQLLSPGPAARYQMTENSLQQAAVWGYQSADIIFALARFSEGRLPAGAVHLLERWQETAALVTCEPGYRIQMASPALLEALQRRDTFRRYTRPMAHGRDVWVGVTESDVLFRYLRQLGFTPVLPEDATGELSWLSPSLHRALPLAQLWIALRSYLHVGHRVPGLARSQVEHLVEALELALSPDEREALDHLLAANIAKLDAHLEPLESQEISDGSRARPVAAVRDYLAAAVEAGEPVTLTYVNSKAQITRRQVQPLRLQVRWDQDYLVAYCMLRGDERCFRLDRIVSVESTES